MPELPKKAAAEADAEDDDEDAGPKVQGYVRTPHEVTDVKITIPDISEVSLDETLEKVGEVMTVLSDTVVVKGMPAPIIGRASEKALDSDTLLVLEDRKVLGYVCIHCYPGTSLIAQPADLRNFRAYLSAPLPGEVQRYLSVGPGNRPSGPAGLSCTPAKQVCIRQ